MATTSTTNSATPTSIWERIADQCVAFRLAYFAPSCGWLASVVCNLVQLTGVYDFSFMAAFYLWTWILMNKITCEAAMVLGFTYDLIIPLQYAYHGLHPAELEVYWPKFMTATMVEIACYFVLEPDLFNNVVFVKSSVTFYMWVINSKKQWPLVYPDGTNGSGGGTTQTPAQAPRGPPTTQPNTNGNGTNGGGAGGAGTNPLVTPDYLNKYLPSKLNAGPDSWAPQNDGARKDEYARLLKNLQRKTDDPKYIGAIDKLKNKLKRLKVKTPEEYAEAAGKGGESGGGGGGGGTQTQGKPDSSVPESWRPHTTRYLNEEELKRVSGALDKMIANGLMTKKDKNEKYLPVFKRRIGDREFQRNALGLNSMKLEANVPIVEWQVPSDEAIQAVVDLCKKQKPDETDARYKASTAQKDLDAMVEAFKKGPYATSDGGIDHWQRAKDLCKHLREIDCPEWLDQLPNFVEGYKIPWETQMKVFPRIIASKCPKEHVRGNIMALNNYFPSLEHYQATMGKIDEETGLKLLDENLAEKSEYWPHSINIGAPGVPPIRMSAAHFKEAKARARDTHETEQFETLTDTLVRAKDRGDRNRQAAVGKELLKLCDFGVYGSRLEQYTDYHPGTRGLAPDTLRDLRWKLRGWASEASDTLLYGLKNGFVNDYEGVVKKIADFQTDKQAMNDVRNEQSRLDNQHAALEREYRFIVERCRVLGDSFEGDGGMVTMRWTSFDSPYQ